MEVIDWGGGLTKEEVSAIETIKNTFQSNNKINKSFFPWKGYSGFRFVDSGLNREGEFDLIIVTHCNVLIIELKDWNKYSITSKNDKWYLGSKDMGRSAVSVTRNKKFLLEKKLDRFKDRFSNKGRRPSVEFFVVMTGNADFSKLPESDKAHVLSLQELLSYKDIGVFLKKFRPHPDAQVLNQDFAIFDELVNAQTVRPKSIRINGYIAEDETDFEHPKGIYKEYLAQSEHYKADLALLRRWNFTKVERGEGQSIEGRFNLVSREYSVLQYLKTKNEALYSSCLGYKTVPQKDEITADHSDLFELLPSQQRFNIFIANRVKNFDEAKRLQLIKLLIHKVADLHKTTIAHRDLGAHSLWLSDDFTITLSGLTTAYFPSDKTLGDIRDILSVSNHQFNEAFPPKEIDKLTAYQIDVRALALLSLHIVRAERISTNSLKTIEQRIQNAEGWIENFFIDALQNNAYKNASELLDAFNQSIPENELNFDFDQSQLEPYCHSINHNRTFREDDDFLVENDKKEVYLSNHQLIKAWLNVYPSDDSNENRILYRWLETIGKIKAISPFYVPTIGEYGIATRSGSLYLVSEYIEEGMLWEELATEEWGEETLKEISQQLIRAVDHLHGLGFSHGDLHPQNIKVVFQADQNIQLYLLDLFDFTSDGKSQLNYEYCPSTAEETPENIRDNYAVMKLITELHQDKNTSLIDEAIRAFEYEKADELTGFTSLTRFEEIFEDKKAYQEIIINVKDDVTRGDLVLYPDNDELYIHIEKSHQGDLLIRFVGLGGSINTIYSLREKEFIVVMPPRERDYISMQDRVYSELSLPVALRIKYANYQDCKNLNKILLVEYPTLQTSLDLFIEELNRGSEINENELIENEEIVEINEQIFNEEKRENREPLFAVKELWKAILDTETEALPYIKSNDNLIEIQKNDQSRYAIVYDSDQSPLDRFRKTDVVELLGIDLNNDKTFSYGTVDIQASSLNEIILKKKYRAADRILEDTVIYLQSKQSKSSYRRRENALSRILKEESVINNLVNYFDETCDIPPIDYGISVSEEEFKRYDRTNEHNATISLNQAQKEAFQRLINYGPVSLLQGPPGTGKTEFIAAFVHYLFEQQNVNSILLVSQSHEAVDTAAERIRRHCARLNTPIDLVRFSNREGAVSVELRDIFSSNIIGMQRERLSAEKIERITALGSAFGLEEAYLKKYAEFFFTIGVQVKRYHTLQKTYKKDDKIPPEEFRLLKGIECDIREKITKSALLKMNEELDLFESYKSLIDRLNEEFSVTPSEAKTAEKLIILTDDMLSALSNDRINYDEFLARSKQLVVGTCVGIGQGHIGIADNTYDWVIVDEAARSISSELAIAMQVGKRILLVGDQEQLPPLYSEEHKLALARKLGIQKRGEELDQALGSDFARVFESQYVRKASAILKTQYRMAPPIGTLISECFYQGKLENGKSDADVPPIYDTLPQYFDHTVTWIDTASLPNAYHEQAKNGSLSNRAEADMIISLLENLEQDEHFMQSDVINKCLKEGSQAIGVICMYGEQKRLVRKRFNEKTWSESFKQLVKIDSVDSYQGKENRIIILSITRHDKKNSVGFLHLPNRINVALSRAMDRLIIVGVTKLWETVSNKKLPLGKVLSFMKENHNRDQGNYQVISVTQKNTGKRRGR